MRCFTAQPFVHETPRRGTGPSPRPSRRWVAVLPSATLLFSRSPVDPVVTSAYAAAMQRALPYGLGIAALAAALLFSLLPVWCPRYPFLLFYPCVALAAWAGGLVPGLVA